MYMGDMYQQQDDTQVWLKSDRKHLAVANVNVLFNLLQQQTVVKWDVYLHVWIHVPLDVVRDHKNTNFKDVKSQSFILS